MSAEVTTRKQRGGFSYCIANVHSVILFHTYTLKRKSGRRAASGQVETERTRWLLEEHQLEGNSGCDAVTFKFEIIIFQFYFADGTRCLEKEKPTCHSHHHRLPL